MRNNNKVGFTVTEIVISMALLALVAFAAGKVYSVLAKASAQSTAKSSTLTANQDFFGNLTGLLNTRASAGQNGGVWMKQNDPHHLSVRNLSADGALLRETTFRVICEDTTSSAVSHLDLSQVQAPGCQGIANVKVCTAGSRLVIEKTYDPNVAVTGDETASLIGPTKDALQSIAKSDVRGVIAQVFCLATDTALTGTQMLPEGAVVRLDIASAYAAGEKQVKWESVKKILKLQSRDVSNIDILGTR